MTCLESDQLAAPRFALEMLIGDFQVQTSTWGKWKHSGIARQFLHNVGLVGFAVEPAKLRA